MATNRDPLLDPDLIAARDFKQSRRGYDPADVRRFLQQVAEAARADQGASGSGADPAAMQALMAEREELRGRVAQLERQAATAENDDAIHVTSLITSETTQVIESARAAAEMIIRKAEAEASRRRKEVKELEQRVDAEIQQKRSAVAEDTARVRRETLAEVTKLRNEADDETKSLRAKADDYASTTRAQAQEILRSRTAEAESFYETRTRKTEETTAAMRAEVEEETTTMRRNAEDASAKMRREAEEETLALRRRTDEEVKALRANVEAEAEDLRTAAQTRVDELNVEADKVRAESENAANIARAEASAAADLASREVRDDARMMVAEARAVREKILTDLVRRRRAARQQIDQARAARDRLVRSLEEVKRQLGEATDELQRAVPDARAAMDRVPAPIADDDAEVAAALHALDRSRPERNRNFADLGESPETEAYARRLAGDQGFVPPSTSDDEKQPSQAPSNDSTSHAESSQDSEDTQIDDANSGETSGTADSEDEDSDRRDLESSASGREDRSAGRVWASEDSRRQDRDRTQLEADQSEAESTETAAVETDTADDVRGPLAEDSEPSWSDQADNGHRRDDPAIAKTDTDFDEGSAAPPISSKGAASESEDSGDEDRRTRLFETAMGGANEGPSRSAGLFGLGAKSGSGTAIKEGRSLLSDSSASESTSDADATVTETVAIDVSEEREDSNNRLAPGIKKQLKRALAYDQNELLDAVSRGGKDASVEDLPSRDSQIARFADALEAPLRSSANNGATAVGGKIWPGMVDGLVAETATKLVGEVRSAVDAAVSADGGEDRSLESIRSHYRDIRSNRLSRLVDSALDAAFDLGAERGAAAES